jgi:hypothetical protein
MSTRLVVLLSLLAALTGCIIVRDKEKRPVIDPIPVPIPYPAPCPGPHCPR